MSNRNEGNAWTYDQQETCNHWIDCRDGRSTMVDQEMVIIRNSRTIQLGYLGRIMKNQRINAVFQFWIWFKLILKFKSKWQLAEWATFQMSFYHLNSIRNHFMQKMKYFKLHEPWFMTFRDGIIRPSLYITQLRSFYVIFLYSFYSAE